MAGFGRSYAPSQLYDYGPGSSITDLILRAGDARARGVEQQGAILGSTVAGLGQMAGDVIAQHQVTKARRNAETAWTEFVDSGTWAEDPLEAFKVSQKIWGPEQGPKMFEGLLSVQKLVQGTVKSPEEAQEAFGKAVVAAEKLSDETLARYWPVLRKAAAPVVGDIGEAYSPEYRGQISEYAKAFGQAQKQEGFTLGRGQVRFGPGGEKIAEGLPEEPPKPIAVGGSLVTPTGEVIYRAPEKPEGAGRPVQVETVDEQGRPVTKFVTPQAGQEFVKPSGQARPATGQQRKALNFFNRMKEADDVAAQLEEGGQIDPTKIKYTPEFANFALDDTNQAYKQAQRAFTESRLRKDSGAAVPKHEYESDALTYFAQPGDSAATIEQKRRMRQSVKAGVAFESGDALREFYGPEAEGMLSGLQQASKAAAPAAPAVGPVQPAPGGGATVRGPNGRVYTFPSAEAAEAFRAAASQ